MRRDRLQMGQWQTRLGRKEGDTDMATDLHWNLHRETPRREKPVKKGA